MNPHQHSGPVVTPCKQSQQNIAKTVSSEGQLEQNRSRKGDNSTKKKNRGGGLIYYSDSYFNFYVDVKFSL